MRTAIPMLSSRHDKRGIGTEARGRMHSWNFQIISPGMKMYYRKQAKENEDYPAAPRQAVSAGSAARVAAEAMVHAAAGAAKAARECVVPRGRATGRSGQRCMASQTRDTMRSTTRQASDRRRTRFTPSEYGKSVPCYQHIAPMP